MLVSHSSGDQKSEIEVLAILAPTGGFEEESIPCLSLASVDSGSPRFSLVYRNTTLIFSSIFT
jgi:hypothetical protein